MVSGVRISRAEDWFEQNRASVWGQINSAGGQGGAGLFEIYS
jgi:hypothetical protein